MFKQVLQNLDYPNYNQGGFNLMPFVNRARNLTHNSLIIEQAVDYLGAGALQNFDRYQLLQIWQNTNCPFVFKLLLTFWWGGISHAYNAPNFYADNQMNELEVKAANLEQALVNVVDDNLADVHRRLTKGDLHFNGINTSFITKIYQFYFHSKNNIQKQNNIVPIICDKWTKRAVYWELTDLGQLELRQTIFANEILNNLKLNGFQGDDFPSYYLFFRFVNDRKTVLKEIYPQLNIFDLETYIFGWSNNVHIPLVNPRNYGNQ